MHIGSDRLPDIANPTSTGTHQSYISLEMSSSGYRPGQTDGDESAKALDRGATSAINNAELSSGIHESANQRVSQKQNHSAHYILADTGLIRHLQAKRRRELELLLSTRLAPLASNSRYVSRKKFMSDLFFPRLPTNIMILRRLKEP